MKKSEIKNSFGFTLAELMAVLLVLAIITLIVFAVVDDILWDSEKKVFERSVDGLRQAALLNYQDDGYNGGREYTYSDGTFVLDTVQGESVNKKIQVDGIMEDAEGFIKINDDGNVYLYVYNNKWCAVQDFFDQTVTIEAKVDDNCNIPTPSYCFEFDESTGTITDYFSSIYEECTTDVIIPSTLNGVTVVNIGAGAFSGVGITSVEIPNTVKVIENVGFYAHNMSSVFIPASVTYVGAEAFSWCGSEPEYLSVTFENEANLSYVGSYAFEEYCPH